MNIQDRQDVKKAQNILMVSNDNRFNYQFIKNQDHIDNFEKQPVIITMDRYDYSLKRDEGTDLLMPTLCPLSLATSKDNLDDMEAFYAAKFPRLPDEYYGILARYSSGNLITKKEIKNSLKKSKKKNTELPVGMKIARGPVEVSFD
jgi:hypothetical protein